jgi:hypothetical protein
VIWKEQHRFVLKHLREFGFGKSAMEEVIKEEFVSLADHLRKQQGTEIESENLFNFSVISFLWRVVAQRR